jgi:hypothetical protein
VTFVPIYLCTDSRKFNFQAKYVQCVIRRVCVNNCSHMKTNIKADTQLSSVVKAAWIQEINK